MGARPTNIYRYWLKERLSGVIRHEGLMNVLGILIFQEAREGKGADKVLNRFIKVKHKVRKLQSNKFEIFRYAHLMEKK